MLGNRWAPVFQARERSRRKSTDSQLQGQKTPKCTNQGKTSPGEGYVEKRKQYWGACAMVSRSAVVNGRGVESDHKTVSLLFLFLFKFSFVWLSAIVGCGLCKQV